MGSKDRRTASMLIYDYYRIGNSLPEMDTLQRLALALFLCEEESVFCALLNPNLHEKIGNTLEDKLKWVEKHFGFDQTAIFPGVDQISSALDRSSFIQSHLIRPRVFLYLHPGKRDTVKAVLETNQIAYQAHGPQTLSVTSGTRLTSIPAIRGSFEIQDQASQQVARLYQAHPGEHWWDACAGSGGKSIVFLQRYPEARLTVSDIRPSILRNLDSRFQEAGIEGYRKKILDLNQSVANIMEGALFDGILLDAPCSGSGTWSRTPEMLSLFSPEAISEYAQRQKRMALNALPFLKSGKPFIYVTCSVYRQENEAVVKELQAHGMHLESMEYVKGYEQQGDTLFAARLIKQ